MIPKSEWKWFGAAGHLIVASDCRFHLTTVIGPYVVSTVGEYWPDRAVREIHAQVRNPNWLAKNKSKKGDEFDYAYMKEFGFQEIGFNRTYETMVFKLDYLCDKEECGRCGWPQIVPSELDMQGYSAAGDAQRGHMEMCEKWASRDDS